MSQKIFFSWQADTPTRTGRNFIRNVLDEVCARITDDTTIDEAMRNITTDSDTQGVAGQPPIVDTILNKIDSSSIVIADMTFVGTRIDGKRLTPNPNVLIEYGWSLKSKSHERVISVMNIAYGKPSEESLPFNLRHIRWPITYDLSDGASNEDKERAKIKLVKELELAIRASLATIAGEPIPTHLFPEADAGEPPARFRPKGKSLGFSQDYDDAEEVFLAKGPAWWFRLIPKNVPERTLTTVELKTVAMQQPHSLRPLYDGGGWSYLRAEDGVGAYRRQGEDRSHTDSVAFVFETGEIWAIEVNPLGLEYAHIPETDIENIFTGRLALYSSFLKQLSIEPPFRWKIGLHDLKGKKLGYPPPPGKAWVERRGGPVCAANDIVVEGEFDGIQTSTSALLPLFKRLFSVCGLERPDYLPQD